MFLNMNAAAAAGVIEHVVDINPRKAGHHIAGTGQEIILPEDLRRTRPDAVIVMNPTYVTEIGRHLRELGAPCTVVARSEEHTSEIQSLMRTPYAIFCLTKQ